MKTFEEFVSLTRNEPEVYIITKECCEAFFENNVFYEDAFREFLCENKEEIEDIEEENSRGSFFYKNIYFMFWKKGDEFIVNFMGRR